MERSCTNVAINSKMLVTTPPLPFVSVHPHTAALILKRVGMGMCFPLKPSVNPLELSCFTA